MVIISLFLLSASPSVHTPSIEKHHHPEPRQGVPPPAKRLSCGRQCYGLSFRYGHGSCLSVACAPLTPLRAAVPFACSHRLGGSTSCSSRQPQFPRKREPRCCHSPLRSLHGRFHPPKRCSLSFIESTQPFAA